MPRAIRPRNRVSSLPLHLMLLPGVLLVLVYSYVPMLGIVIAFQDFIPARGIFGRQDWVGLESFRFLMGLPEAWRVLRNTLFIATLKIVLNLVVPIVIALMLNEVRHTHFKRISQTLIYLPNFLSWVILGGILVDILSPEGGIVNRVLGALGLRSVYFLGEPRIFPFTLVVTDVWKEFGFATVVYLAALTAIDPALYDAASIDGAGRWRQTRHITLPGMKAIIFLVATLSLGNVLNAGFDQVFNLYSPQVFSTGDIIDTFVYRIGLVQAQYGLATAVGLFKSVISLVLISGSYYLAYRFGDYRVF